MEGGSKLLGLAIAGIIIAAWSLTLFLGLGLEVNQHEPLELIGFVLIRAFLHTGLFIVAHDAMHTSLFPRSTFVNDLVGRICLFLYGGLSYQFCRHNHQLHHRAPETCLDPDFLSSTAQSPFLWYIKFLRTYLHRNQFIILGLTWASLFASVAFRVSNSFLILLLVCVLPMFISSLQLFIFGTWLPHRHLSVPNPLNSVSPRSLPLHPFITFAACYHFSYHWEHHTFPSVPWYQLPRLHWLYQPDFTQDLLPVETPN